MVRTAFVASYPPRQCSVARFTHNLASAVGGREIVALYSADDPKPSPLEVHHRIRTDEPEDYVRTARSLCDCSDVASIQHDFDVWAAQDGRSVLEFVNNLDVPSVATLHSVPGTPDRREHDILAELVQAVTVSVVTSRAAATLLEEAYGADPRRVEVIAHGVPELPLVDAATVKPAMGLAGREILLSFGQVGPDKGWELAISALPQIVAAHPAATYVMVGATHPDVLRRDGEAYRESLVALAGKLGMTDHVLFVDRFVGRVELTRWLEAADLVIAPSTDPARSATGTLAYAMAAGRAVISTPFIPAAELLADGRGVIVAPGSAAAIAAAAMRLLADAGERAAIGRRAHEHSRPRTWWNVAAQYRELFGRVVADHVSGRTSLAGSLRLARQKPNAPQADAPPGLGVGQALAPPVRMPVMRAMSRPIR